jgi:phosphatidylserine/phosphatidylglycerophosphate/cardiolipin synthase-like enzyme
MAKMVGLQVRLIERLSARASLCRLVFEAWADLSPNVGVGVKDLTAAANLSYTEEAGVTDVLDVLRDMGLLEGIAPRWRPTQALVEQLRPMAAAFGAIDVYQSRVHRDATQVGIVTTKPDRAIALDRELACAGWQAARTEDTDESILSLFTGATRRIVVMTPFLDRPGAVILKSLLQRVHEGIEISLVLRNLDRPDRDDYPIGYPLISDWLREYGVSVFNYSLRHIPGGPVETFHAKLVLADDSRAYVGSANMTGSSFENSVELGVLLSGGAARQLEHFVRAVIRCAQPWQPTAAL